MKYKIGDNVRVGHKGHYIFKILSVLQSYPNNKETRYYVKNQFNNAGSIGESEILYKIKKPEYLNE